MPRTLQVDGWRPPDRPAVRAGYFVEAITFVVDLFVVIPIDGHGLSITLEFVPVRFTVIPFWRIRYVLCSGSVDGEEAR